MTKKLYRSKNDRVLAGVCGGIGEYLDIDPVLIRFLFLVFTVMGGSGIVAYILAVILIPEDGIEMDKVSETAHKVEGVARDAATKIKDAASGIKWSSRTEFVIGMLILLFGLALLLQIFASIFQLTYLWPLVLVVAGLVILVKR